MKWSLQCLFIGLLIILGTDVGWAKVYMSQSQALALAFPSGVEVKRKTVFLTESQATAIQTLAKAKLESRVVTYYVGHSTDGVTGYAFFDSHIVRTMPETIMVVIAPQGVVRFVEILAFAEPEDYLPRPRWLTLFQRRSLDDSLRVRRGIANIAGATLTAEAISDAVRRVLALYRVLVVGEEEQKGVAPG